MTIATSLLTAEEFWLLPDTEMQRSLVRGVVVETMPPGACHRDDLLGAPGVLPRFSCAVRELFA